MFASLDGISSGFSILAVSDGSIISTPIPPCQPPTIVSLLNAEFFHIHHYYTKVQCSEKPITLIPKDGSAGRPGHHARTDRGRLQDLRRACHGALKLTVPGCALRAWFRFCRRPTSCRVRSLRVSHPGQFSFHHLAREYQEQVHAASLTLVSKKKIIHAGTAHVATFCLARCEAFARGSNHP